MVPKISLHLGNFQPSFEILPFLTRVLESEIHQNLRVSDFLLLKTAVLKSLDSDSSGC